MPSAERRDYLPAVPGPTVSLIIATYNWPEALATVLSSVRRQSSPPAEVIIADDGSGPETKAVIDRAAAGFPVPIRHVWQEDQGFRLARIRNRAMATAAADYLIHIDGDCVLHRHFMRDFLAAARPIAFSRGSRTFLSAEQTAEVLAGGRLPGWWDRRLTRQAAAFRQPLLLRALFDWRTRGVQGHNLALWRSDALRVNGFDERFEGWGGEDNDLAQRLINAGVVKRRLRFGGLVFHLDHHPAPRPPSGRNNQLFDTNRQAGRVRVDTGIDQHR